MQDAIFYKQVLVNPRDRLASPAASDAQPDSPVRRVLDLVEKDLVAPWGLNDLAESVGLSPFQLHRRFRRAMGETVGDYVRRARLGFAMTLLGRSDMPIIDIALETGYGSQAAFTRVFVRQFGLPPDRARNLVVPSLPVPTVEHRHRARATRPERLTGVPLVAMRFHGAYPRVPGHWQRFASQLRDLGFDLSAAQAVGILYDDPAFTPEHRIRYDCCVVDPGFPAHRLRGALRHEIMRPGEYAQLDVAGAYPVVAEGMFSIASLWLPQARRTPAASPAYEIHRRPPWNDQGLFEVTVLMALR